MRNAQSRLNNIEDALTPNKRLALCFVRDGHREEDRQKQFDEYKRLHGDRGQVTFIIITNWTGDNEEDYDSFIQSRRSQCGRGNCFVWWPEEKEETEI